MVNDIENKAVNSAIETTGEILIIVGDALSGVPILTTLTKLTKLPENISDALLCSKIKSFFENADMSQKNKEKLLNMFNTKEAQEELGYQILLYLNAVNEVEKPKMMAKVFRACLNGKITKENMYFYWHVINSNLVEHLREYFNKQEIKYDDIVGITLNHYGFFVKEHPDVLWNGKDNSILEKSSTGLLLCSIVFEHC